MKRFKLVFTVLLILVVVIILGLFIFLKTVDINRFKTQITQQISKSIGRDVTMRNISINLSLLRGMTLDISGLSMMDHPDFSTNPMLYVDSAHLDINILPFIFGRQILVSKVELNSLNVNLVRNSAGEINFQKLSEQQEKNPTGGIKKKDEVVSALPGSPSEKTPETASKDINFGEMLIRSIRVTDGTFVFTDQMATPPLTIPVTQMDLQVSNLSLDKAFPFELTFALWSEVKNIRLNGSAHINTQGPQVRIDDLKVQTDLADLLPERIEESIPSVKEIGLQGKMDGQIVFDVHQMVLGEGGLLVLSSEGRLTDGTFVLEQAPVPIEHLNIHVEITESDATIKSMTMPFASGELNVSGQIIEYLKEQKFLGELSLQDIQISELTAGVDLPAKIEGKIYGNFKGNGKGFKREALKAALNGEGTVEVKGGRIVDVNLLKLVLSKISFIPNLVNQVEQNLPEKYKEKLKQKDTILEKVEINIRLRDDTLFINRAELIADGFLVTASGKLDFDQNLNLEADFYIPEDLSASLVASAGELSYLLDEHKRIHVPFKPYQGKLADFIMYPDIGDLGMEVIKSRGKEELKKILRKVLDLGDQPSAPPSEGGEQTPQEQEISPEEAIIENILDIIPIFR